MDVPPVDVSIEPRRRLAEYLGLVPPYPVVLLGLSLDALAVSQIVLDPEAPLVQVFEVGVPIVLTLAGFYGALHVHLSGRGDEVQPRLLLVAGVFMAIAVLTVVVIDWMRVLEGGTIADPYFPVIMAMAAGYGVGATFGIYYDEALLSREQLSTQVKKTRTVNQRLQVVLRMLRHNVRNEIQIITGVVEYLRGTASNTETMSRIDQLEDSAQRLHSHSERALRVQELDPEAEPGVLDLVEVIDRYLDRVDPEIRADTIEVSLPDSAPVRAKQIIDVAVIESVRNALQHNDPAELTVRIEIQTAGDVVELVIADDGSGVPESERTALAAESESPLDHGSGVGLWLIRWVVEDSNGEVIFEANEPQGFRVRILLPSAENPPDSF